MGGETLFSEVVVETAGHDDFLQRLLGRCAAPSCITGTEGAASCQTREEDAGLRLEGGFFWVVFFGLTFSCLD